ncbi:uncharacterized protein YALI1_E21890g [Yarrowia lipolytica]|uniref:Uncharacterized protein n=1 Tax=Yarrowia lipolytica TaxID=4952 RepID=A0A1D8NIY9_YARLL|nr:hypothetical protein YALI1_E21890g [Yarrowia lipolytica]
MSNELSAKTSRRLTAVRTVTSPVSVKPIRAYVNTWEPGDTPDTDFPDYPCISLHAIREITSLSARWSLGILVVQRALGTASVGHTNRSGIISTVTGQAPRSANKRSLPPCPVTSLMRLIWRAGPCHWVVVVFA